jgi:hypothetical protein
MAERNQGVPQDRRMLFRTGINLGDILIDGDDILGDGVNIAARLLFQLSNFRYLRSLRGAMRPHHTPKLKKRTALLRGLKEVFRRHRSQPIGRV